MAASLTKRERVMRAINFQEVDRIPTYDILVNDGVIEHYAGEKLNPANGLRVKAKATARCLDMTRAPFGPGKDGRITNEDGLTYQTERWTTWIVERPFNTPEELAEWVKEKIVRLRKWQPDAAFVEEAHEHVRRLQAFYAAGAEVREDIPVLVIESPAGLDQTYAVCGLELFSMLMAYEPELTQEWIEEVHQAELRRVRAIADPRLMPVVLTFDDMASKNGPLFRPDWLRQYHFPRLKRLVDEWHSHDTVCLFHSDGNLMPILDDLVAAGIDGLNPLETMAGMSITEVRKHYPDRLFLTGGIDVSQLLPFGTPEEVRARCLEAIKEAEGVGYFLGSTTELEPCVPVENAVTMYETPALLAAGKLKI